MKNRIFTILFSGFFTGMLLSSTAFAQDATVPDPGHPRVNEVDQRLQDQQNRMDNGVKDGQINGNQLMHDENRDQRVQQELSHDESKHNGHLTKREQRRMNRQLNKNSRHIRHQRHKPAAAAPATSR